MRTISGIALAVAMVLSAGPLGRAADDDKDARAVVAKAIQAAGGEANLKKFRAATWTEKGTYFGMGDGIPFTAGYAMQLPDKFKIQIPGVYASVVNGDKGWIKRGDTTTELTKEQLAESKEELYAGEVANLYPLKDKAFRLSLVGDDKVGDRPAVAVKVAREGHREQTLYFDKDSGLLLKTVRTVRDAEQGDKELTQETLFQDYKDVDGAKHAMKVVLNRDGKKFVEAEVSDLKPAEKLDDSEFAKP